MDVAAVVDKELGKQTKVGDTTASSGQRPHYSCSSRRLHNYLRFEMQSRRTEEAAAVHLK